jgi:hypothetical protein
MLALQSPTAMALTVLAPQQLDPMLSLCCCNADSCAGLCNAHWDACRRCESVDYCGVYYSALPHAMLSGVTAMLPLCCKLVTGVHAAPGQNSNHTGLHAPTLLQRAAIIMLQAPAVCPGVAGLHVPTVQHTHHHVAVHRASCTLSCVLQ